jgi:hypothetical protein
MDVSRKLHAPAALLPVFTKRWLGVHQRWCGRFGGRTNFSLFPGNLIPVRPAPSVAAVENTVDAALFQLFASLVNARFQRVNSTLNYSRLINVVMTLGKYSQVSGNVSIVTWEVRIANGAGTETPRSSSPIAHLEFLVGGLENQGIVVRCPTRAAPKRSYRAVNKLRLGYKNQSVNAV